MLRDDRRRRSAQRAGPHHVSGRRHRAGRAKNRVTFSQENQYRCEGSTLTSGGDGCRQRGDDWVALGSTTLSPEASGGYFEFPYYVTQATWTVAVTNRLLLEAGFSRLRVHQRGRRSGQVPPDGILDLIPVTEQAAIDGHPANFSYRGVNTYRRQLREHEQLARVGVVRDRRAQHEGRLPGRAIRVRRRRRSSPTPTLIAYRFNNGVAEPVHRSGCRTARRPTARCSTRCTCRTVDA